MRCRTSLNDCFDQALRILIILIAAALPCTTTLAKTDTPVGVLRFKSSIVSNGTLAALDSYIREAGPAHHLIIQPQPRGAAPPNYENETGISISLDNMSRYDALCDELQSRHLLMGRLYRHNGALVAEARIYSSKEKKFLCIFEEPLNGRGLRNTAEILARKTALCLNGALPAVSALVIGRGSSGDAVPMKWTCNASGTVFTVYRSPYQNGPYVKIGETTSKRFTDNTAETGIKYWYRISPMKNDIAGIPADDYGYRRPPGPAGMTLKELLGGHTRPWPEHEEEKDRNNIALYEKYYESYFMMNFIIMVGSIYINNGELLAFRGFRFHSFDQPNRIIYFSRPGMPPIKFFSRRFFRFLGDVQRRGLDFNSILTRMIDNAVFFCIRAGDIEQKLADGRIRYIPTLEVAGMATEYYRDYEKWESATIMFGTSDKDLYRRIREAQMKGF